MRYAPFLKKQGTIGFVAPSFGCNIEPYRSAFENALKKFRAAGYRTVLGPNCYEGKGIGISNTPEKCGAELMAYYCSADNDVLISCGGGELMCEVLNHLDFDALANAPAKWYMGFSDNTNMTFLLATLADTAAIYGPCAAAFGMEPWHPSVQDAFDLLQGKEDSFTAFGYDKWEKESLKDEEHPLEPYNVTEPHEIYLFLPGRDKQVILNQGRTDNQPQMETVGVTAGDKDVLASFSGRLLGGCMDCLVNLLGTRFDRVTEFQQRYQNDGIIWFLESCDLNVMAIRRAVWQMKNAGWFQYVKGFLIGRPLCYGEELMGLDHYHAVVDLLSEYDVPIVMDLDIGHIPPMMPLVCGSIGDVTVRGSGMQLSMKLN